MPNHYTFEEVVGTHPVSPHPIGERFSYEDGHSEHGIPTRTLSETDSDVDQFVAAMREFLRTHHSRPEDLERDRLRREAYARQGLTLPLTRFPTNPKTRKGNWTEVLLCEYVTASCNADLPVYRLRYNPNVDQSMKGDDVLAFDLNAHPIRIIVGEAKFRGASSKKAVTDIIESLERSFRGGLPVSLQFVANRLIVERNEALGRRIEECADLFVRNRLRIDHVGLLASNHLAPTHVEKNAISSLRRIAVISMTLSDGEGLVNSCFNGLESTP
ncbi:HamA C-terminal domain-containing protein [Chlorobium ferrooxidans]|uniref:Anti-bacteriophage protein A/HamA C-terminal domain-containing protein n=1 Tax=Chlorobium ferrooxidans DSM 13031 TaxID=377431 RepID=Q0YV14_9CHLB|nr:hypothetical protein CferDRAFT_2139 [Chlorobium ferrooxidans DSM 13031]